MSGVVQSISKIEVHVVVMEFELLMCQREIHNHCRVLKGGGSTNVDAMQCRITSW